MPALVTVSLFERLPHRLRPPVRDAATIARHGRGAPRYAERIWVDPAELDEYVPDVRRWWSGRVLGGGWDTVRARVDEHPKVRVCDDRWRHGRSWAQAGAYAQMLRLIEERGRPKDGCADLDDIVRRYRRLDTVFEQVRAEGRLRTRAEAAPGEYRELGGVLVNIDRHGRPVAGGGGWHRLAMARLLELPLIPAQVGVVHAAALPVWRDRFAAAPPSARGDRV